MEKQNIVQLSIQKLKQIKEKIKLTRQRNAIIKQNLKRVLNISDEIYKSLGQEEKIKQSEKIDSRKSSQSINISIPSQQIIHDNIISNIQLQSKILLSNQDINLKNFKSFRQKEVIENGTFSTQNPLDIFTFVLFYFFQKHDMTKLIAFKDYIIKNDMSIIKNMERFKQLTRQFKENQIDEQRMKKIFLVFYKILADKQSPFKVLEKYDFFDYASEGFLRAYLIQKLKIQEKNYQQTLLNYSAIEDINPIYNILAKLFELQYVFDEEFHTYTFKKENQSFTITQDQNYYTTVVD